jgi:prepilin-type N-terminal cleavage/methylation domain-containing protein
MKDKGFTLVELLAAMVILALLIFIGTMAVSNIFDNTKDNYYKSLENTLNIAGNEYFSDNRADRPIDDYNFVDMETLVDHEYMDELTTYDGKDKCSNETGVYIYNDGDENRYEACLVCGEYKSEGTYCNGTKIGTIHITGNINDKNGPAYNPLLSYSGTKWINASNVWIHFNLTDEGVHVSKYTIYNANGNSTVGDCTASGNKCSMNFQKTGSYYVEAFDGSNKVGNRKYFNVKFDNTPPTMDLKNLNTEFLLYNDKIVFDYENEVININDDNGYKEVKYTLTRYNPNGNENIAKDKDIKDLDFKIKESLQSGKYDLYITVTDFAGNKATQKNTHITFYIKYNVDLQYFDNKDNRHDAGRIKVYTYGKYDNLPGKVNISSNPQEVSWYLNANLVGGVTTSSSTVNKTGYHVLYGKEAKFKVTLGARCNNLTYNAENQQLATIPNDEKGKYRLVVYYGGQILANEAIDAKTYTVIAMLNPGYTWDDGTTKAKALQCNIKPYPVDFNPNTNPCKSNLIYNAGAQLLTTSGTCYFDNNTPYLVGGALGTISCIGNKSSGQEAGAVYYPIFGINAGNYPVTYHLTSSNFVWADGTTGDRTYTCKIKPFKVAIPSNPCKQGLIYNGDKQYLLNIMDDGGEQKFGIWHQMGGTYGDYARSMAIDDVNDMKLDYRIEGDYYGTEASDNYPIMFILSNNDEVNNYTWSDGSTGTKIYVCEIKPYPISVPTNPCKQGLVYNGNYQDLTTTKDCGSGGGGTSIGGGGGATGSGNFACINFENYHGQFGNYSPTSAKNAGEYPVTYRLLSPNVSWPDGSTDSKTYICKIEAKRDATVGSCNTSAKANGSDILISGGKHVTYSKTTSTTAGDNVITIKADDNYAFSDGQTTKKKTCNVKSPCTWQWKETGTDWNLSSCTNSDDGSVRYVCSTYTGGPWKAKVTINCDYSPYPYENGLGSYDNYQDASNQCSNGQKICNEDCGSGHVRSCNCSVTGVTKYKRVKSEYVCE